MATLAVILGGAIANAVAFTGGQAIFHATQGGQDPAIERKRHDEANEALNKATVEWSQQRLKTLDFINRRLKKENQSHKDFNDVDDALELYNSIERDVISPSWGRKPKLSDFYQPSEQQKNYEYVFIIGGVIVIGIFAFKHI